MSILARIPPHVRAAAVRTLPTALVERLRKALIRRYHLPYIVEPESALRRFVKRRILRMYYPPSMITRQSRPVRWFHTRVLRQKPRLFHFEIHLTDHCNLNCKGCLHFSNLSGQFFVKADELRNDLRAMARLFDTEQVYLMGGEALLHPDIAELLRVAREELPRTRLSLMTNGLLVTRMDEEFWTALADTDVTLICGSYPIKLPAEEITALSEKHGVRLEWTTPRDEFFKIPIDLEGTQDPVSAFRRCEGVGNCAMVRKGRLYPCAYSAYSDVLAGEFKLSGIEATDEDSFAIHEASDPEAAMRFMLKPIPWCRHCDFGRVSMYQWGHSRRELSEWVCTSEVNGNNDE